MQLVTTYNYCRNSCLRIAALIYMLSLCFWHSMVPHYNRNHFPLPNYMAPATSLWMEKFTIKITKTKKCTYTHFDYCFSTHDCQCGNSHISLARFPSSLAYWRYSRQNRVSDDYPCHLSHIEARQILSIDATSVSTVANATVNSPFRSRFTVVAWDPIEIIISFLSHWPPHAAFIALDVPSALYVPMIITG